MGHHKNIPKRNICNVAASLAAVVMALSLISSALADGGQAALSVTAIQERVESMWKPLYQQQTKVPPPTTATTS